jgi:hypothetical protein
MNNRITLCLLLAIPLLTSCYRQAYFLSPFNANTNFYHAMPARSDSVKAASYVSGAISAGGANQLFSDEVFSFHGNFHRSHTFSKVQAWYGANLSVGSYHVSDNSFYINFPNTPSAIYQPGTKFFGGMGVSGGFNLVTAMGSRHEWRIIGLETTVQNEYGKYLDFRKKLPDSAANAISRNRVYATVGLTTEFLFKLRNGNSLGYKLAIGSSLQKTRRFYVDYDYQSRSLTPVYVSNTLQITRKLITGFGQINFGDYAANFQMGVCYRLGGKKSSED